MIEFFEALVSYNTSCNQQLIQLFLQEKSKLDENTLNLFSHILNAHHIWNSRILRVQSDFQVWGVHALEDFERIDLKNASMSCEILKTVSMDEIIPYKNSKGDFFESKVQDILFHIMNHSTYHRGQIAFQVRQASVTPIPTDFIWFKR